MPPPAMAVAGWWCPSAPSLLWQATPWPIRCCLRLPTTLHADHLEGPLGRLTPTDLAAIAAAMIQALDLHCLEPWQAA
jgi:hypothetical protein